MSIDPSALKSQLNVFIPADVQKLLGAAGIRDEYVFPVPILLEAKPTLVGYYRLLLGVPQKSFYASSTGMSKFKSMEAKGILKKPQKLALSDYCYAMIPPLADLVRQMSPSFTNRDLSELPLLTIGSQFQGGNNTKIGKLAVENAFIAVTDIVKHHIIEQSSRRLLVENSARRKVALELASDPDIGIHEDFEGQWRKKVAIEIKGGTDRSNAHNRAGEAEKSHQKAKKAGYRDFWTMISKKGLDMKTITAESPTTNSWFEVSEVLAQEGNDWNEFRSRLAGEVGIPLEASHN